MPFQHARLFRSGFAARHGFRGGGRLGIVTLPAEEIEAQTGRLLLSADQSVVLRMLETAVGKDEAVWRTRQFASLDDFFRAAPEIARRPGVSEDTGRWLLDTAYRWDAQRHADGPWSPNDALIWEKKYDTGGTRVDPNELTWRVNAGLSPSDPLPSDWQSISPAKYRLREEERRAAEAAEREAAARAAAQAEPPVAEPVSVEPQVQILPPGPLLPDDRGLPKLLLIGGGIVLGLLFLLRKQEVRQAVGGCGMRTRRSPRNQEILWRALSPEPRMVEEPKRDPVAVAEAVLARAKASPFTNARTLRQLERDVQRARLKRAKLGGFAMRHRENKMRRD